MTKNLLIIQLSNGKVLVENFPVNKGGIFSDRAMRKLETSEGSTISRVVNVKNTLNHCPDLVNDLLINIIL